MISAYITILFQTFSFCVMLVSDDFFSQQKRNIHVAFAFILFFLYSSAFQNTDKIVSVLYLKMIYYFILRHLLCL